MKKPGIVLIHGAGLGSYIWQELKPYLQVPALTIDLPNRLNNTNANKELTLEDYAASVIKAIASWDQEEFIIVAHSIGGCVGLKVAAHFGSRVKGFVGISAAIPKDGDAYASIFSFPKRIFLPVMLSLFGTKPPEKAIASDLGTGLSEAQKNNIVKRFTPESKKLYLNRTQATLPATETMYVICSNDHALPVDIQEQMAENLQAKKIMSVASGHLPMMSHPKELAEMINDFVKL